MKRTNIKKSQNYLDEQIKPLSKLGIHIKKKSLEQYIEEAGANKMIASKELDWGTPVGDEIW